MCKKCKKKISIRDKSFFEEIACEELHASYHYWAVGRLCQKAFEVSFLYNSRYPFCIIRGILEGCRVNINNNIVDAITGKY